MYQQEIQLGENGMGEKLRSFSPIFDEILKTNRDEKIPILSCGQMPSE